MLKLETKNIKNSFAYILKNNSLPRIFDLFLLRNNYLIGKLIKKY